MMRRVKWSGGSTGHKYGRSARADAGRAAYRATRPASGAGRDRAPGPRRRPSAAVLLTLLALNAGRVVSADSLAGEIWPDDPPGNPGNALQTLVSRLRGELRQAGIGDVIESHPAGYRLAVPPEAVDVMAFEALVARGRRALAASSPPVRG